MFTPTLSTKETSQHIKDFVKTNESEFWKIFKPLIPFIVGLNIIDVIITALYMPDSKNSFALGSIIAAYFMTSLVISWHRVVIHGADNYVPMNPLKPKKHELVFIGVGLLIGLFFVALALIAGLVVSISASGQIAATIAFVAFIIAIYISYRICFYFPAKAVNANITLQKAFVLSKGYLWKFISSSIKASVKLILLSVLYVIIATAATAGLAVIFNGGSIITVFAFLLFLPITLYFHPLITIIGVTALSNYYLYAIQNEEKSVEAQ